VAVLVEVMVILAVLVELPPLQAQLLRLVAILEFQAD
jgi:hypothetical protein